jgi:hypothetical protein
MRRTFLLLAGTLAILPAGARALRAQSSPTPGVYTDSQATRGQLWYESACVACHPTRDMSSPDFQLRWQGLTAFELFDRISNTMPLTAPGTLSRRTYTDIVAYLLRINGLPAGSAALASDTTTLRAAALAFKAPSR